MEFNEYQDKTRETAVYPGFDSEEDLSDDAVTYCALGLAGEAGEVAEKVKKYQREDDIGYINDLQDELGDVLWYLARLSEETTLDLDYVARRNLRKLKDRDKRNQITGEGDNR